MILNHKQNLESNPISINIGKVSVKAETNAKLLGVMLDSNQKWKSQIHGAGGTVSSLNSRLYLLRRLARAISNDRMKRINDSLYTSKIRYGIQLFGKVRLDEQDPTDTLLESLQITQNNLTHKFHGDVKGHIVKGHESMPYAGAICLLHLLIFHFLIHKSYT